MSSGLISQEDEGTTSGRLDAPLYCLGAGQLLQHVLSTHMQLHAHTRMNPQKGKGVTEAVQAKERPKIWWLLNA